MTCRGNALRCLLCDVFDGDVGKCRSKKTPKRRPTRVIYALQYDTITDFEPIGLLAHAPMLLVVNKAIPADYLNEFIAWLKANPDKASSGPPEPAVRLTC